MEIIPLVHDDVTYHWMMTTCLLRPYNLVHCDVMSSIIVRWMTIIGPSTIDLTIGWTYFDDVSSQFKMCYYAG